MTNGNTANIGRLRVAAAVAALLLFSPPSALAADDPDDDGYITSTCTVVISGAPRPMYTEKEMKLFDKSFEECMKFVSNETAHGGDPEFEYIEVKEQSWKVDDDDIFVRRERGRELRSSNFVSTAVKCRRCDIDGLPGDRRQLGEALPLDERSEARRMTTSTFDACMFGRLTADVEGKSELAAFDLSGSGASVTTTCALNVRHEARIADVLGENENGTDVEETTVCTTEIDGAAAPMLREAEMAHFDRCMIDEYNKIYGYLGSRMVENEICDQDPSGLAAARMLRDRRGRRRLGGRNRVLSQSGSCRLCDGGGGLYGDRRRRLMEGAENPPEDFDVDPRRRELLLEAFNTAFCGCLMSGAGHDNGEVHNYTAFEGALECTTTCDEPIPTVAELDAQAAEMRSSFETKQLEDSERFETEYQAEEERLEKAMVEHKLHRDRFDYKQTEDKALFEAYQTMHYEEQMARIRSTCSVPKAKLGRCDGIRIPMDMIEVIEAKDLKAKFKVHQKFAYDSVSGQCDETRPGFGDVPFLARFAREETEGVPLEYECKGEKKKCGESVQYEAKHCYFDADLQKMVADFEIAIDATDFIAADESSRRVRERRGLLFAGRELEDDDEVCRQTRTDVELGVGNMCYVHYQIDCGCAVAGM